jgi:uncharacterized protein (DUF2141 family)
MERTMMPRVSKSVVSAFWLMSFAVVSGQQAPVRDAAPRPSVGTAILAGTVVTDDPNGRPLRRVTLTLNAASSGPTVSRMTTTDDQGRFAFTRLPAGNYTALRASKAGFVTAAYGQKRVGGLGIPLALTEGQRLTVAMKMLRGGVITGAIADDAGKPLAQVGVQASPIRIVNGERLPAAVMSNSTATTDDRGVYRIYGLAPGDYVVSASARFFASGDVRPVTADEVRWAQQQLQPAGAVGASASTASDRTTPAPRPAQAIAYSPVYYPGTTDVARATPITVVAGQELPGVDFRIQFVPTAKIEGTVFDPDGQPAQNVQMNVIPKTDTSIGLMGSQFMFETMMMGRPQVVAGKFTIPALKPGEYTISARAAPRGAGPPAMGPAAPGGRGGPTAAPMSLWAMADVSVAGVDQSNLVMRLEPGMTLAGRVAFEGRVLQPPADLTRVSLRLMAAPNTTGVTISVNPGMAQVAADGSFAFTGITPGRYLLSASAPPETPVPGTTWLVKSAIVGKVDGADTPIEVKPGQSIDNVLLTFTDKTAEVSGTLSDATGKPTSEFSVILFSVDKTFWGQRSRRFKTPVRAGMDGKFTFTGLPAGDYYLAALTDFEPSDVSNPLFLEQVIPSAVKVTVAEGEKKAQDLKLAGGV